MHACMCKTAASLPRLVVEVTSVAKWKVTIMGRDGPSGSCVNKLVICNLWREKSFTQCCVQLGIEIQQWQGNYTGGYL